MKLIQLKLRVNNVVSYPTQRHLFKTYFICTLKSHGEVSSQSNSSTDFIVSLVCTLSYKPPAPTTSKSYRFKAIEADSGVVFLGLSSVC